MNGLPTSDSEFRCHYCDEWFDIGQCETHFAGAHEQSGVTIEKLTERLACLGGIDTRRAKVIPLEEGEPVNKPSRCWLFGDDFDEDKGFETNNFRHN